MTREGKVRSQSLLDFLCVGGGGGQAGRGGSFKIYSLFLLELVQSGGLSVFSFLFDSAAAAAARPGFIVKVSHVGGEVVGTLGAGSAVLDFRHRKL